MSTLKRAINRPPTSLKAVSNHGLPSMVAMKISSTKIDLPCAESVIVTKESRTHIRIKRCNVVGMTFVWCS